jgi:hypothetical protein
VALPADDRLRHHWHVVGEKNIELVTGFWKNVAVASGYPLCWHSILVMPVSAR